MVYALAVRHIYYVLVCVQKDLLTSEPWELIILGGIFSHFFVDLLFEFFEFSFYVIIDVSDLV